MAEESPLLIKYKKQYERNPRSTIFAPLAEMYRKLGMIDKALEVLHEGIRHNPSYVMGYLTLASCYFDRSQFPMAYATLRPLVDSNKDNLRLLKLFARTCFELAHNEEALEAYKYLLFLNPRDNEVALKVRELEDRESPVVIRKETPSYFDERELVSTPEDELDQWTQVDFGNRAPAVVEEDWTTERLEDIQLDEDEEAKIIEFEGSLQESSEAEEADEEDVDEEEEVISDPLPFSINTREEKSDDVRPSVDPPIVTHTLVDLYCAQGYYSKAKEILQKILELNPTDQKTIDRIHEVQKLIAENGSDSGDDAILAALDRRRADDQVDRGKAKEEKLLKFLDGIKRKSVVKRDFLK